MFCDLVGSTELSSKLDPEDLNELIRAYQARVVETINRHDGFIARYMGDGVLVYFGWPEAGENDAERAVHAALVTAEAVAATPVRDEKLRVRIGIATGLVVVGDQIGSGESREQTAIGETPNRAARLQALAAPGGVVIDTATRQQIGGLFECQSRGAVPLKGLPEPVETFDVFAPRAVQSRFEALRRTRRVPLIGREEELEILFRRWGQAKTSQGRLVLISGEPGIGKSRLLAALDERLRGESLTRLRYFCAPHQQANPLYPVIGQLEFAAGFERENPAEERRRKLGALLAETATGPEDEALLADLLSLPMTGLPTLNLSPQQRKEKTFDALIRQTERLAARRPVLMLFEDAHWADPSTLELMDLAFLRLRERRVLVVMTFRPEFQAPWTGQAGVTLMALSRLEQAEAAQLASQVTLDQVLPPALLARIVAQAEGVPLFVEELTKAVLESRVRADAAAPMIGVPETLQASLMARLDRLPLAKQVAQVGAVIGREFSDALIRAVSDMAETTLAEGLEQIVVSGLVFRRGEPPEATYVFKHALVQDAAYETLLRSRRAALHGAVAAVLERDAEVAAAHPALLAHHFTQAGLIEKAADFWSKAGQRSLSRSALIEATEQLRRALTQIAAMPSTPALRGEQIKLLIGLANAQMQTKGYAAPDTKASLAKARLLIEDAEARGEPAGDKLVLFSVLYGFWVTNLVAFNGDALRELAAEFLAIAKDQKETVPLMIGHRLVGTSSVLTGDLEEGRAHLDRAIALYVPSEHRSLATRFASDVKVNSLASRSLALFVLGHPDAARTDAGHALEDAREIGHAPTLMVALAWGALTHLHCGDHTTANTQLDEVVELAEKRELIL
jgi:class 3 adenylate cyclase